jgi:ABC-type Zn2+ transport system substrate-binding protein/surface adhesin
VVGVTASLVVGTVAGKDVVSTLVEVGVGTVIKVVEVGRVVEEVVGSTDDEDEEEGGEEEEEEEEDEHEEVDDEEDTAVELEDVTVTDAAAVLELPWP